MSSGKAILAVLRQQLNRDDYRKKHWEGKFEEYLDIVREHPEVTRTAYQRLYDMILSHGTEAVYENKEKVVRCFFSHSWKWRSGAWHNSPMGKDFRRLSQERFQNRLACVQGSSKMSQSTPP